MPNHGRIREDDAVAPGKVGFAGYVLAAGPVRRSFPLVLARWPAAVHARTLALDLVGWAGLTAEPNPQET